MYSVRQTFAMTKPVSSLSAKFIGKWVAWAIWKIGTWLTNEPPGRDLAINRPKNELKRCHCDSISGQSSTHTFQEVSWFGRFRTLIIIETLNRHQKSIQYLCNRESSKDIRIVLELAKMRCRKSRRFLLSFTNSQFSLARIFGCLFWQSISLSVAKFVATSLVFKIDWISRRSRVVCAVCGPVQLCTCKYVLYWGHSWKKASTDKLRLCRNTSFSHSAPVHIAFVLGRIDVHDENASDADRLHRVVDTDFQTAYLSKWQNGNKISCNKWYTCSFSTALVNILHCQKYLSGDCTF